MLKKIFKELKEHIPFTAFGALLGVVLLLFSKSIPQHVSYKAFYIFHPAHVLLSSLVTASMYHLHQCPRGSKHRCNLFMFILVGFIGSVGIATLSDSLIPYLGEVLLDLPHRHAHIGFIEKWWLINPLAFAGILIAYFKPQTKFPHLGHVLISTWASLFHMLMAKGELALSFSVYIVIFIFLFIAVWLPCCLSDIVFPLLFVKSKKN
ncbi:MAG: hypothetical protein PHV17_01265 [Candidatus Omnitrophica bacterium]|nr:hypothetical protein [Candidatus Omnitrophota bacterium]